MESTERTRLARELLTIAREMHSGYGSGWGHNPYKDVRNDKITWITATFPSDCHKCGVAITKGDPALWFVENAHGRGERHIFCSKCGEAIQDRLEKVRSPFARRGKL